MHINWLKRFSVNGSFFCLSWKILTILYYTILHSIKVQTYFLWNMKWLKTVKYACIVSKTATQIISVKYAQHGLKNVNKCIFF